MWTHVPNASDIVTVKEATDRVTTDSPSKSRQLAYIHKPWVLILRVLVLVTCANSKWKLHHINLWVEYPCQGFVNPSLPKFSCKFG